MSARDDLIYRITRHCSAETAEQMVAAHRAEVLAEADLLPKADVVAWLVKKAREETPVWLLASKVERGAVRPDNLRMLAADFFEPGHTYTEPDGSTDWAFRCDTITTHPEDGERTALGWRHFRGQWSEYAYGEDDWDIHRYLGHAKVTTGGESK